MRITGLGETIAMYLPNKICCAINYQTFDNFLFLFLFLFSDIWPSSGSSSSSPVFPDSHFQREKFEGLNE